MTVQFVVVLDWEFQFGGFEFPQTCDGNAWFWWVDVESEFGGDTRPDSVVVLTDIDQWRSFIFTELGDVRWEAFYCPSVLQMAGYRWHGDIVHRFIAFEGTVLFCRPGNVILTGASWDGLVIH